MSTTKKYGARIYAVKKGRRTTVLIKQTVLAGTPPEYVIDGQRERHCAADNDKAIADAVRAALAGNL